MIGFLSHLHLLVAAALMAAAALIASVPSVLYMFYERRALERVRRKANAKHSDSAAQDKPKAAHA
jgi:Na+/H+ antiporter NhaD/arsenite permease-like protein